MTRTYLKDAARRRVDRHGGSYQSALHALTRYDRPRPRTPRHPPGIDWTPLHGVEVAFTSADQAVRGVVLPPDGVRPGADVLRVAITDPREGVEPAEVTYLDARCWSIAPMPHDVDQRFLPSRRRTRGPRGLPLYRHNELPAAALATKTMLRRYRMRLTPGQRPIAEYLGTKYADLYAIDDAERLPALSPARHATWERARTCARCDERQLAPLTEASDGNRYCQNCYPAAADECWTRRLSAAQHAATVWALQALADPTAVIVAASGWPFSRIAAVNVCDGQVLVDLAVALAPQRVYDAWKIEAGDPRFASCLPLPQVADLVTNLADRRVLSWTHGLSPLVDQLSVAGHLDPAATGRGRQQPHADTSRSDNWQRWYAYWLSLPAFSPSTERRWSGSWSSAVSLLSRPLRTPTAEQHDGEGLLDQCLEDHQLLRAMATGGPTPERITRIGTEATCQVYAHIHDLACFDQSTDTDEAG